MRGAKGPNKTPRSTKRKTKVWHDKRMRKECDIGDKMLMNSAMRKKTTSHLPFITWCHHTPMIKLLLMVDFETLNKKDEPVKSKSNSKPRRVWQKKVALPLEAPLQEAPPHESSSSKSEPRYSIKEHRSPVRRI
jgi:hypothetical protein